MKIDRKSVEWHRGLITIPVLEVNSRGVDGLETGRRRRRRQWDIAHSTDLRSISTSPAVFVHGSAHLGLDIFNLAEMREQPYLAFPSMWSRVALKGEQQQCPDKWMAKLPFIGSENFVT